MTALACPRYDDGLRETVVTEGSRKTYHPYCWRWPNGIDVFFLFAFLAPLLFRGGRLLASPGAAPTTLRGQPLHWADWVNPLICAAFAVVAITWQFKWQRLPVIALSPDGFVVFRRLGLFIPYSATKSIPYASVERGHQRGRVLELFTSGHGRIEIPLHLLEDEHRRQLLDDLRPHLPAVVLPAR